MVLLVVVFGNGALLAIVALQWWFAWWLLLLLLCICLADESQCALLLLLLWLFNCAVPFVAAAALLFTLQSWYAWCCCSNAWLTLWSLPCNEWQNFFVLLQSSFSDKLNIENDGSPVTSFTIFKKFGKHSSNFSPSSDEYVSNSIKPLHLEWTEFINETFDLKWWYMPLTLDGLALCTRPIGNTDCSLGNSAASCRWWNVHRHVAPANSCSHDVWFGFLFPPIDYAHADAAMYAYTTSCLSGHASVAVPDILAHSIADNDAPHRNPESPEIHYRSAIFHQLRTPNWNRKKRRKYKMNENEHEQYTCSEKVDLIWSV